MLINLVLLSPFFACNGDKANCPTDTASAVVNTDGDGDGFDNESDCNDLDASINPGAEELCDNLDNNCDGLVDDDDSALITASATEWFLDSDEDGYGTDSNSIETCIKPAG